MGREFEVKFAANQTALAAVEAQYGDFSTTVMETTYFDTPNRALSARRITLRRRLENGRAVCTLKTPTAGLGRGEWEIPDEEIAEAIPELCKLSGWDLLPILEQGVVPVCGARFTRQAKMLVLPDCTVELALDRGVLLGGGKEIPLWELEVELKEGSEEGVLRFARSLAAQYALLPEKKSKFRRAFALATGE